jgi:hypothetical protein
MDNAQKLEAQIHAARPGLRIDTIWHEQTCTPPCRCAVRAVVLAQERDGSRSGFKMTRRIVRLRDDAPEAKPFAMASSASQEPSEPEKKREPLIKWENG